MTKVQPPHLLVESVSYILHTHAHNILKDELGAISPFKYLLHVQASSWHRFFKHRPVPSTINGAIEAELESLEQSGVITKVMHNDCVAPIVPVSKKSRKI